MQEICAGEARHDVSAPRTGESKGQCPLEWGFPDQRRKHVIFFFFLSKTGLKGRL